ncbi:unnamed protein product, partial [Didymodactylos carnosus]
MERYGQLLEKAMHEEVPSNCEDWRAKQEKRNQSKSFTTPSTTSSKSSSKQYRETPASKEFSLKKIPFEISIAKRLRFTTDHDDGRNEDQQMDLQQILNYIKQVNANVLQLQKQQQQITVILERQEKFLNMLCTNQKKIAKSLTRHKIPVFLENDDENTDVKDDDFTDPVSTYTRSDGVVVQLLKTYGTKENTVKYALKLMDSLFVDKQDLQNVDVKKIDEDPRIKAIY